MTTSEFKSFKFGFTDAEQEGAIEPNLLLDGFLDPTGFVREVKHGNKFLFLGYKGSGKSAIGEHLRLTAERDSHLFVTNTILADFPYSDFARIVKGDAEAESRFPTAWSWLILLALFDSFSKDNGASPVSLIDFNNAIDVLKQSGLMPAPSLKEIVRVSSKRSFKLTIPTFFEAGAEKTSEPIRDIPI